jgi:hypothetical protein
MSTHLRLVRNYHAVPDAEIVLQFNEHFLAVKRLEKRIE